MSILSSFLKLNSLRKKLYFYSSLAVVTISTIGLVVFFSVYSIKKYNELNKALESIIFYSSNAQISCLDFMAYVESDPNFVKNGSNVNYVYFFTAVDSSAAWLDVISNYKIVENLDHANTVESMQISLKKATDTFKQAAQLFKERGFKDLGKEGEMRAVIHSIESRIESDLMVSLLTLRRHEKDFLLRKDLQYKEKFDKEISKFKEILALSKKYSPDQKEYLSTNIEVYRSLFYQIIEMYNILGFDANSGLKGRLQEEFITFNALLVSLSDDVKIRTNEKTNIIIAVLISLFLLLCITAVWASNLFVNKISRPILELKAVAESISAGNLTQDLERLKKNPFLDDVVYGFDKMILKIKEIIQTVSDISSKKLRTKLEITHQSDEVSMTLNVILDQLIQIEKEEAQRNWRNEGMTLLAKLLRNNYKESGLTVYDEILKFLVQYSGSQQGILYSFDGQSMVARAVFAHQRKKHISMEKVEKGVGLVGAVWQENETIFLTEIPEGYSKISSGLGESSPAFVLICPVAVNDEVQGIIEIAGIEILEDYKKHFFAAACEMLGSFFKSEYMNEKTQKLLEESQYMTAQLRSQEETLRQNMEELLATQETLARSQS